MCEKCESPKTKAELEEEIEKLKLQLQIKKLKEELAEKPQDCIGIPHSWMEEAEKLIPSRYKVWCKSL